MPHVEVPSAEFKVVLLGDTNTGKTCLVLRLVEGAYKPTGRSATVGAFFLTKRLTVNNITCKMLLWDTAGQEQFQKLAVTYYQHAAAALVCYDMSNPQSLTRLRKSLEEVYRYQQQRPQAMVLAVCACKADLQPVMPGLEEEARRLAQQYDAQYFTTSAKTDRGVLEVFQKTAARVLELHELAVAGRARPLAVTVGTHHNPGHPRQLQNKSLPHSLPTSPGATAASSSPMATTPASVHSAISPNAAARSRSTGFIPTTTPDPSSLHAPRGSSKGEATLNAMLEEDGILSQSALTNPASSAAHHIKRGASSNKSSPDVDSNSTEPESDADENNGQPGERSSRTMCEGSYLVCAMDVPERGNCVIL